LNIYVVDASVAAKWFFDEIYADVSRQILQPDNRLYAPDFFLLEMDSIFCKRIRRGELSAADAEDARILLSQLPVEYHAFNLLQNRAYDIANQTQRSIYDCLYLALAVVLNSRMVTADYKFFVSLSNGMFSPYVEWVENV